MCRESSQQVAGLLAQYVFADSENDAFPCGEFGFPCLVLVSLPCTDSLTCIEQVRAAAAQLLLKHGHRTNLGLGELVEELIEQQR